MGNLSGEFREQNPKDKVTRFRSVTYARQLGLLVNTLGSHLKISLYIYIYISVSAVKPQEKLKNSLRQCVRRQALKFWSY